jgi:dTDP-glucose 4,6-dehydratase
VSTFRFENVLVTGGLGFMGSDFVDLMASSYPSLTLTVFDKADRDKSSRFSALENVQIVRGHLESSSDLEDLVEASDCIVNFAAETHNDTSLVDPDLFFSSNVAGTYRLLRLLQGTQKRFHQVSTDEVFGDIDLSSDATFGPDSPLRPSSPYSTTKAFGDLATLAWVRSFGINATLSNSCNNFGVEQNVEKLIPNIVSRLSRGERPEIYGDGLNVREWLHVSDHSSAIEAILKNGKIGSRYLIGSGVLRSNLDVLGTVLATLDYPEDHFTFIQDRRGHDRKYKVDWSLIRKDTGWEPVHTNFEEKLSEIAIELTRKPQ